MSGAERQLAVALANRWQRGFPLAPRPFAKLGEAHGLTEQDAMAAFSNLYDAGILSRIGAIVRPNAAGASTLAALSCAEEEIERVAAIVSAERCVNHNYERGHAINLWFVAAAADDHELAGALTRIAAATGCDVLDLRLERPFHIDLGFDIATGEVPRGSQRMAKRMANESEKLLLAALEDGLPLTATPFGGIAMRLGCGEAQVIAALERLLHDGIVSRFGCILRHRELGFSANAMAVWNVPDAWVDAAGHRLAEEDGVTLCYRRRRDSLRWPYNLYAMVHGRDAGAVRQRLRRLTNRAGLESCASEILFSKRCFTQRGARFSRAPA